MPWDASDAKRFTKKASGNKGGSSQWAAVANKTLKSTGDDGTAIKTANGVVKNASKAPKSTPKVTNV